LVLVSLAAPGWDCSPDATGTPSLLVSLRDLLELVGSGTPSHLPHAFNP